jgi:Pyridine nucleotide-disulphide oxidoreductase/Bacterial protein of unknown function (DUF839)
MNRKSDVEESSRRPADGSEHFETVIIGGGQAGLSVGYHLKRQDRPFVILDTNERIGDSWRKRWDSLRLFTPARYNGLTGLPFPSPAVSFPTKDEMADYLETYAARFDLPVRTGVKVDGLSTEEADKMNAGIYTTFKNNGAFVMPAGIDDGVSGGEVFQFASGPVQSELTGPAFTPVGKTLFLAIQHPGEESESPDNPTSTWPGGDKPESSLVAITSFA